MIFIMINSDLLKLQKQKYDQYPSWPLPSLSFFLYLKQLKSSTFDDQS